MEFFVCPCPGNGLVVLNGKSQGPNKTSSGRLATKQCNEGQHIVALRCASGNTCGTGELEVEIKGTDPICPTEFSFHCA